MNVCSHQPSLLPWIGFWNKLVHCQQYIALCGVKYGHHDFQNRVKVKGAWLTIPVSHETKHDATSRVMLADDKTCYRAGTRIKNEFMTRHFKYGERLWPVVEFLQHTTSDSLCDVNLELTAIVARILGVRCEMQVDMWHPATGLSKTQNLVVHVLRHCPDPVYYAGQGTLSYLDMAYVPFQVMAQQVKEEVSKDSILQLIAEEKDPMGVVFNAAVWSKWNG